METVKSFLKNNKYEIVAFFFFPLLMLFISTMIFQGIIGGARINISAYTFSYFIFLVFNTFFDSIIPKKNVSKIVQIALLIIVNTICINKYMYIGEPLYLSDILLLPKVTDLYNLGGSTLTKYILYYLFYSTFIALFSYLLYYLLFNNKLKKVSIKQRIISFVLSITLVILFMIPSSYLKDFVLKSIYGRDRQKDYMHNTTYIEYYTEESLIGGLYSQYLDTKISAPTNYDKKEVESLLSNIGKENTNNYDNTNIIVMFSESFFDLNCIKDDITFDKEISKNFNELKEKGKFVNMISPTYGGLSSNVEFELLTGFSMNFFPNGYIPYMQLYNSSSRVSNSINIIKELKKNGYYTEVVFGKDYYNSKNAYLNLGIDEYNEYPDGTKKGYYTSDEYLVDKTIEKLLNKEKNQKMFYMNCTIQSHMPFVKEKYDSYDISIINSTLPDNLNNILLSYAQGTYDADRSLKKLYDFIQTIDEPTILVFFGDHLPYLQDYNTKENVLDSLSYFNTENELINTYRKYNTQALILANYDITSFEIPDFVSPDLLLTSVINNINVDVHPYYSWLFNNAKEFASTNNLISQDTKGNILWTSNISENIKNIMKNREKIQYSLLLDN